MIKSYQLISKSCFIGLFLSLFGTSCQGMFSQQAMSDSNYPKSVQLEQVAIGGQELQLFEEEATSIDYESIKQNYIHLYGRPTVEFKETKEKGLSVKITTKRLIIEPASIEDLPTYAQHLYGSPKVMEKFASGETKDEAYAKSRIGAWIKRWEGNIPFSGLTIRTKEGEIIGHVVLGGGDEPESSEVAYMLKEDKWKQGFGYEAVGASILFYAAELKKRGYPLPNNELFTRIIATTRKDNTASEGIQKKIGMTYYKSSEKFGYHRDHYELSIGLLLLKDSNI